MVEEGSSVTDRRSVPNQRSGFDRGAWLNLVVMLLLLSFAFGSTIYRFTLPTDGWLAKDPDDFNATGFIYQKNIMEAASGLQPGDNVVAVEGISLAGNFPPPSWAVRDSWRLPRRTWRPT